MVRRSPVSSSSQSPSSDTRECRCEDPQPPGYLGGCTIWRTRIACCVNPSMNPDEMLQRFRAVVAYDGTEFAGFQAQEHVGRPVRTVQAALEHAVLLATGYSARVVGAGRTDRGVHASGQVVHFDLPVACALRGTGMLSALNSRLPPDLRVLVIEPVSADFHARFSATSRCYRYTIENSVVGLPTNRRSAWNVRRPLSVIAMNEALGRIIGSHDFAAFGVRVGSDPTRRVVLRAHASITGVPRTGAVCSSDAAPDPSVGRAVSGEIWHTSRQCDPHCEPAASIVVIEVEANAFLRHMMRRLVGTLVRVGHLRVAPDVMDTLLVVPSRGLVGPAAPPHGLCLVHVAYDGTRLSPRYRASPGS
ncbi:MAG: tRNA pseudouridine synthase A [Proteobacteria bacterium]|nr:tRNA pseudouridine synthase A [Pseudomonadota bacterium]NDE74806.1 tRNA pseudouridine synthase A [Pseudomonadota bacterium]